MPLPTTGPISMADIQSEFGGSNPISLSEYYANGPYVPLANAASGASIPTAGQIRMSDFRGKLYPSLSGRTGLAFDTSVLLGTSISNPVSLGDGTVVFRTASTTQHYTYRSTDGGRTFSRVDPAQSLSGFSAGRLIAGPGIWAYLVGTKGDYYVSKNLTTWTVGQWPTLPTSYSAPTQHYYFNGTSQTYATATFTSTTGSPTYEVRGNRIIRRHTVTESRTSYVERYTNKPQVIVPGYTNVYNYETNIILDTGTLQVVSTILYQTPVKDRAGSLWLALSGSSVFYTGGLLNDVTGWTSGGALTGLYIDGLSYRPADGQFVYLENIGYFFYTPVAPEYNGTAWTGPAGVTLWHSPDGHTWSLHFRKTYAELYGSNVPTSVILTVAGGLLVLVPRPNTTTTVPILVSEDGSSWEVVPLQGWPASGALAGVCWTGDALFATHPSFRAVMFA